MKRSEMIKILIYSVHNNLEKYENYLSVEGANNILEDLEKAGMLPPKREVFKKAIDANYGGLDIYFKEMVSEWEPEDK